MVGQTEVKLHVASTAYSSVMTKREIINISILLFESNKILLVQYTVLKINFVVSRRLNIFIVILDYDVV